MTAFTQNPFALLDDDELPAAAPAGKVNAAPAAKQDNVVKVKASAAANGKAQGRPPRSDYPRRGGFRGSAGAVAAEDDKDAAGSPREDQHRRHARRPRRGQRGGWSGHGRQMDRHSGLPRDSEKKVSSGWGHAGDEEGTAAATGEEGAAVAVDQDGKPVEDATPVEEEPVEEPVKTLDDYLAEQAAHKLQVALPAPRKANEGSDESKWKNTAVLQREEDDIYFAGKEKKTQMAKEKSSAAALKQHVPINMKFSDERAYAPRSERGGRGGRGGYRGGRGGGRGSRPSSAYAPNVNDSKAFPILTK